MTHCLLAIAVATEASFIRVNVHIGAMITDQGLIEGRAAETLRLRDSLDSDVAILADVGVKHATPFDDEWSLEQEAKDAWNRGLADALIVSGSGTGSPTFEKEDLERIQHVVQRRTKSDCRLRDSPRTVADFRWLPL